MSRTRLSEMRKKRDHDVHLKRGDLVQCGEDIMIVLETYFCLTALDNISRVLHPTCQVYEYISDALEVVQRNSDN